MPSTAGESDLASNTTIAKQISKKPRLVKVTFSEGGAA
ncbi:hypothetical protein GUI43_06599 [Micromonospora noduli]|nr:hypothetical protein GUI43_06599 [Micromonospora noduli]